MNTTNNTEAKNTDRAVCEFIPATQELINCFRAGLEMLYYANDSVSNSVDKLIGSQLEAQQKVVSSTIQVDAIERSGSLGELMGLAKDLIRMAQETSRNANRLNEIV